MKFELHLKKKDKIIKKENYQPNADKYWRVILGMAFVLITGSFVFGYILFKKTTSNFDPNLNILKDNSALLRKERIDKALDGFSDKKSKTMEVLSYPAGVVDPSL
ncbi:MAG: hypothetical protein QG644_20 [Patescibacteria group bacterium]|nr:hypothetical protein [Patescibacteria group bacterium]